MDKRIINIMGINFYCVATYIEKELDNGNKSAEGNFKIYEMSGIKIKGIIYGT